MNFRNLGLDNKDDCLGNKNMDQDSDDSTDSDEDTWKNLLFPSGQYENNEYKYNAEVDNINNNNENHINDSEETT